jgi:hypothetical protein
VADAMLLLPSESAGVEMELKYDAEYNIPAFTTTDDLARWFQNRALPEKPPETVRN